MSEEKKNEQELELPKLSPAQYWEWRCSLEEINSAKLMLSATQQKQKIKELEAEVSKLRALLFKKSVDAATGNLKKIQDDFQEYRKKLEAELGMSLESCVVDPVDYSIKKL